MCLLVYLMDKLHQFLPGTNGLKLKKGLIILQWKWFNFCFKINTDRNKSIPYCSTSSLNSAGVTEPVCEPQGKSILQQNHKNEQQIIDCHWFGSFPSRGGLWVLSWSLLPGWGCWVPPGNLRRFLLWGFLQEVTKESIAFPLCLPPAAFCCCQPGTPAPHI